MMSIQGSSLPVTSNPSPSCPQTPIKSVALLADPSVTELCGGTVPESAAPETIASPSSTPGSATLQQNSSSNCNRLNQSFTGTSSLDVGQPCGTKQLLELSTQQQPASQHQPHQSQIQASIQDPLQQDQLPPTQQLHQQQQQAEQNQHMQQQQSQQLSQNQQLQQLQQSHQQLGHLGQQLQLGQHIQTGAQLLQGQHFHAGQQLQQTLQLQQGQQLLQSQQLQQLIQQQQQQGQQLLHGQPPQVQQLLQQQQGSQQQLMQQHIEQQHHQSQQLFLQHQGQSVMQQQQQGQSILQPQGQSVVQQSIGQPQYQNSQRFLSSSAQHLMSQHGQQQQQQQQLLQQSQLMHPLQQQIMQQTGQQQLISHIQPAGQQLYQTTAQPGMFQQQSNQQLLQAQLLQPQPGQQLLQQQSFQLNQQQQQQQTQQQLLQTQQLNSLQQQIVLQAIQAQGLGNLSGITGRSLSLVPSGSSIGLVNAVPATVYRHLGSTVGTSSTTLTTQISKGSLVTGSRVALSSQPSAQRQATVQVVQQRQNAPLFIGQFGMGPNGTIIPSGIVPLARPQASASVNVQANSGQPQILASPTQIQLAAAPLLGSTGNILNQQTLQVAMAQIQQQQQQSPGANLLTSQQPLYIQTGISVADGNGTISSMTLPRFSMASGSIQPLGLSVSLPVQIPIGVAGFGQAVTAKPTSWSVSAGAVASSCPAFQMDTGQLKMNAVSGCSDLTHSLAIESIPLNSLAQNCGEIGEQNYEVSLGFSSQLGLAPQVHLVTGLLSTKNPLDTDNRQSSMKPEDFPNSSMALGDCGASDPATKDGELNVAANPEKQTAKVMPQILTHIIEGFVIQEGPEPFPVQRSSFMREYLDSTDDMTDSSCEGQSGDEADDKLKSAVNTAAAKGVQEASHKQTHVAKEITKCCAHCAKEYEPPSFGKMGKFCSQSCAKRSAATSRWTMYHVNKQNEAASPSKQSARRRTSNVNGRGWIRTNENRNTVSAQLQRYSQMSMSGSIGSTQVSTAVPTAVTSRPTTVQIAAAHAPHAAFDSGAISAEHEAGLSSGLSFQQQQQRTPPAQVLTSPRQDRAEVMQRAPPAVSRDSQGEGSDPTLRHPSEWGVQDVYTFVRNLPGCSSYADEFRLQEIDGQALLLLKEDHFMTTLNLKLGPALKICQQIAALKDSFS